MYGAASERQRRPNKRSNTPRQNIHTHIYSTYIFQRKRRLVCTNKIQGAEDVAPYLTLPTPALATGNESCLQGGWRYVCVRKIMHNAFHDNWLRVPISANQI